MNFIMEGYFIIFTDFPWLHVRLCVRQRTCLSHLFITTKGVSGGWNRSRRLTGILLHRMCVKSRSYYAVLHQALSTAQ